MSKIYIAVKTAVFSYGGHRVLVRKGHTTAEEGHPILAEYGGLFAPLVPTWSLAASPTGPPDVLAGGAEDTSADPDRPRRRGRPPKPVKAEAGEVETNTETNTNVADAVKKETATVTPPAVIEYVVKAGDSLSTIAAELEVEGGWRKLYEINKDAIGPNPSLVGVGTKLVVPEKS